MEIHINSIYLLCNYIELFKNLVYNAKTRCFAAPDRVVTKWLPTHPNRFAVVASNANGRRTPLSSDIHSLCRLGSYIKAPRPIRRRRYQHLRLLVPYSLLTAPRRAFAR